MIKNANLHLWLMTIHYTMSNQRTRLWICPPWEFSTEADLLRLLKGAPERVCAQRQQAFMVCLSQWPKISLWDCSGTVYSCKRPRDYTVLRLPPELPAVLWESIFCHLSHLLTLSQQSQNSVQWRVHSSFLRDTIIITLLFWKCLEYNRCSVNREWESCGPVQSVIHCGMTKWGSERDFNLSQTTSNTAFSCCQEPLLNPVTTKWHFLLSWACKNEVTIDHSIANAFQRCSCTYTHGGTSHLFRDRTSPSTPGQLQILHTHAECWDYSRAHCTWWQAISI